MKAAKPKDTATSRWLSFRPEIKVLDCTIRDGGLMNNHHFDDQIVKAVYDTCVAAGIDYMELGYKASRKGIKVGVADTGLEAAHEDLAANVDLGNSFNFLTGLNDPSRAPSDPRGWARPADDRSTNRARRGPS